MYPVQLELSPPIAISSTLNSHNGKRVSWDDQGGGVILFTWLNFLQEELLEFLGLDARIDISAFSERLCSKDEESQTTCDNNDNLKLVDDDEVELNQDDTLVKQDSVDKDGSATTIINDTKELINILRYCRTNIISS